MMTSNWLKWAACGVLVLGALCVLLTAAGGIGNQTGLLHFHPALGLFFWAGKIALPVAAAGALVLIVAVFMNAPRGVLFSALAGLILAGAIYVPYHMFMARAQTVPRIHDITTDTQNPPVFVRVAQIRPAGLNSLEYGGKNIARQQEAAYPEVKPVVLDVDRATAYTKALAVVKELSWEIVDASEADGRIEATDTTFFYGFKDDVVIRVSEAGPQKARIDIRSASRVGVSDVGVNAERVVKFLHKL